MIVKRATDFVSDILWYGVFVGAGLVLGVIVYGGLGLCLLLGFSPKFMQGTYFATGIVQVALYLFHKRQNGERELMIDEVLMVIGFFAGLTLINSYFTTFENWWYCLLGVVIAALFGYFTQPD